MSTINFNDGVYAQDALKAFVAELLPVTAFARDFSPSQGRKGDAVYVPRVDAITSTTFNQDYEVAGGTINTITVNIDQHRIAPVDFTDRQAIESSAVSGESFAMNQGKSLAKIVLQDILSVITTTNFGEATLTTAGSNFDKSAFKQLRKAGKDNDVTFRNAILDNDLYDGLLDDTSITQALNYGGPEAIREGRIPRLLGMNLFESNIVPLNGISLGGFACHPDAIAVGMRYLPPVDGTQYSDVRSVTDPETGINTLDMAIVNEHCQRNQQKYEGLQFLQ